MGLDNISVIMRHRGKMLRGVLVQKPGQHRAIGFHYFAGTFADFVEVLKGYDT